MITSKEALQIGKAILQAKAREQDNFYQAQLAIEATNALAWTALQNLWYDVFSEKVKQKFNYSFEVFYTELKFESKP